MDENKIIWNIIDSYFKYNSNFAVKHHLDSYNLFFNSGLKRLFMEKNPIRFFKEQDEKTKEYRYQCNLYLGGKSGERIYYGKPIIYDDDRSHFMYPNEARLRNMNYSFSIHYDVEVEYVIIEGSGKRINRTTLLEKIYLGRFPIMLQSDLCVLKGLSKEVRFNMGECRNDSGGYFIIDGKEKVILCQEKFANNTLYIREGVNDFYSHSAEIKSASEDASKPVRTLSVRIVASKPTKKAEQIVVSVPNVRKPIPLFILMRALGVISDQNIIQTCLLDLENESEYIELFRPSVHDAGFIFTQTAAISFIASFTKRKTVSAAMEILSIYFLPHIGELNFKQKALYLGYIVKRLLAVYTKDDTPTDRDSFQFKRIETAGNLISQLFKEYFNLQHTAIYKIIDYEYYFHMPAYQDLNFYNLIENNVSLIFSKRIVDDGFKKAFKGNWGAQAHTKRLGVVQDLSRLSYFSFLCHLRKLNVPMDSSAKIIGPRLLHGTQWGFECPIHTPDGGNVGLHKHLSIMTHITSGTSGIPFLKWLRTKGMMLIEETTLKYLSQMTKVFINGAWVGGVNNPQYIIDFLKLYRRTGIIPIFTSVNWNIKRNEIIILTDGGRPMRPIFYVTRNVISWQKEGLAQKILTKNITWKELVMGFAPKKIEVDVKNNKIFDPEDVYSFGKNSSQLELSTSAIDYIDAEEEDGSFIAMDSEQIIKNKTTHVEIHPSLILGIMANMVIFPENNPLPRSLFSCGQSKQAVSLYNSNYQNRIDKMAIILNYGQIPLIKSRFLNYTTKEQHPYGENAIVAIACYTGYNVEDAVIVNKAALDRGLFRTTYFNMYEAKEESSLVSGSAVDSTFCNIHNTNVVRLKPGYDYSYLDKDGLVKENTKLDDKIVLIGKCTKNPDDDETFIDSSVVPKKGQKGYVDKSFITEGNEGFRLAKIRVRHERIPAIGDKFCSRAGQKGTIGIVLPEEDMPFNEHGQRPDIIVNPHAFPSRMTIGHLIESLVGKACSLFGAYGDCTAFVNKGPKQVMFGSMLTSQGFHSSGTEILYNGMNGKQLEADIYFGPTYYLRLKHMVKDKMNARARGPRTALTRQTVQGRANNGGLRIGEMDRDAVVANGMSSFLEESFMERGDKFFIGICNQTGSIAIYNESKNIFLSPLTDGPIEFDENLEGDLNLKNISRYGRDFSIIRVPYSFKLLYQELKTMNIQMRIITEKNIDQLTTLIKGNNISKLTKFSSFSEILKNNIEKLTGKKIKEIPKENIEEAEEKAEKEEKEAAEMAEDVEDAVIVFNSKKQCFANVNFEVYNPRYPNVKSDVPYALDETDLNNKIKLQLQPQFFAESLDVSDVMFDFVKDKLSAPFFNGLNISSKRNTLDYLFHKIRSGYFLQIQNGKLKEFIPFYNVAFKNNWSHLLNIDKLKQKGKINPNKDQWVATNCLLQLVFKPLTDHYSLDTFMQVKHMFSELCNKRKIPNIDLIVNVKDFPLLKKDLTEPFNHIYNSKEQPMANTKDSYYPILSFNSNNDFTDIPIPSNHEWSTVTQKIFPSRCITDYKFSKTKITWEEKQGTAIFRGTATGCSMAIEENPRLLVSQMDKEWSQDPQLNGESGQSEPYLNAGITKFPNRFKTTEGSDEVIHARDRDLMRKIKENISMKKFISLKNQCRYKYILNIPGNSAAYRLGYLLRSGSVILNVESENKLWWETQWKPMEHYIPIQRDLSDLKEKIEWCKNHDEECQRIVENAKLFADQYISETGIFNYLELIINSILSKEEKDVPEEEDEDDDRPKLKISDKKLSAPPGVQEIGKKPEAKEESPKIKLASLDELDAKFKQIGGAWDRNKPKAPGGHLPITEHGPVGIKFDKPADKTIPGLEDPVLPSRRRKHGEIITKSEHTIGDKRNLLTIQENNKIKRDHQYPDTVEEGAVRRHQEKVGQPEKTTTETVQKIVDEINQEAREQK